MNPRVAKERNYAKSVSVRTHGACTYFKPSIETGAVAPYGNGCVDSVIPSGLGTTLPYGVALDAGRVYSEAPAEHHLDSNIPSAA